ncbi:MAG: hypothetical protein H6752_10385 [Candidatus Omnitrophica bacterium]|nr:hypothetical protein [Candidatus Omnitrophota bacterium]
MPQNRSRQERTVVGFWLVVGTLLLTYFYIQPGWPRMGDGHGALSQTFLFRDSVLNGEWPSWSFFWYGGWSFTRAYGPLFSAPSGLLDLVLHNPKRSVVLVFLVWHWVALIASYFCARSLGVGRYGAVAGALVYAFCGQFSQTVLRYGSFNLSLFYALAPVTLFLLAKSQSGEERCNRFLILASMSQALSLLNHAELGLYSLVGNTLLLLLHGLMADRRAISRLGMRLLAFTFLSVLLSSFYLIQFYVTARSTLLGLEPAHLFSDLSPNLGGWAALFSTDYSGDHPWSIQYVGWVGAIIALLGIGYSLKTRNRWGMVFFVFLVLGFSAAILLSRLRILHFFVLPFAMLAGFGVDGLVTKISSVGKKRGKGWPGWALISIVALLTLTDQVRLLPRGQYEYLPTVGYFESPETVDYFEKSRSQEGTFGRTLQIRSSLEASSWSDMEPLVTGLPTLAGGNHETAPKSWPYTAALIEGLVDEVSGETTNLPLEDLCLLAGVRFLAHPTEARGRIDFGSSIPASERYQCFEMNRYSPIVASSTYTILKRDFSLDEIAGSVAWRSSLLPTSPLAEIANTLNLDRNRLVCDRLLFREKPTQPIDEIANAPIDLTFTREAVSHTRAHIEFECFAPCYLRLAYPHDPRLQVMLDGEPVETVPTAMHLTGLACPTIGQHHLEIRAVYLPIERIGWGLSAIAWVGCLGFVGWSGRKET